MRARKTAFTLVELLVVISIIALLIAILLPSLKKARDQTKKVACASNVRSLTQATLTYAVENKDFVPLSQAPEPSYVYARGSQYIIAPAREWHLGELLMPQMNMDPVPRSGPAASDGAHKFTDADLERTADAGEVFYCPATKNGKNLDSRFPTWQFPTQFGSFMDYALFWGWVSSTGLYDGGWTRIKKPESIYHVLDDQQQSLPGDVNNPAMQERRFAMPNNVARDYHRRLPDSGPASEVPVFADYTTSFNKTLENYSNDYANGEIVPEGGNHRWTGRSSGSKSPVFGGNFSFIDGHAEWRNVDSLRPRLLVDREFTGGTRRPTYWW